MRNYEYYIYIIASKSGTLYTGVTNNLERRITEHKQGFYTGFTKSYHCHRLLYFEQGTDIQGALAREKQIKNWRREKKEWLIKKMNPTWKDLSADWG